MTRLQVGPAGEPLAPCLGCEKEVEGRLCEACARACVVAGDHLVGHACDACKVHGRVRVALEARGVDYGVERLPEVRAARAAMEMEGAGVDWMERTVDAPPATPATPPPPAPAGPRPVTLYLDGRRLEVPAGDAAALAEAVHARRVVRPLLPPAPPANAPAPVRPAATEEVVAFLRGAGAAAMAFLVDRGEREGLEAAEEEAELRQRAAASSRAYGMRSVWRFLTAWRLGGPSRADACWQAECPDCERAIAERGQERCAECRHEAEMAALDREAGEPPEFPPAA